MPRSPYFTDSRSPRYAVLFAAPLLVAYETFAWLLSSPGTPGVRNGADVMLKAPFVLLAGSGGVIVFEVLLMTAGIWLVAHDWRRHPGPLRWRVFALMLAESIALALIVGVVLRLATATLLHYFVLARPANLGMPTQLMVSLGAGIYEELLFRVILVGGLSLLARRVFGWKPRGAAAFAVLLSALLFSSFHYIGAYGDTLRLSSFLFRFLAGLVFSTLYVLRGFGVTAWTHALYDVIVTVGA
ncbi:MAG: CPBP family intramembrane glutamic endopeptidase [Gemmatimonadales bacterium]